MGHLSGCWEILFFFGVIGNERIIEKKNPQGPGMSSEGRVLRDVHFKFQHWGGGGRKVKKFKVIFGYLASSRSAWAM